MLKKLIQILSFTTLLTTSSFAENFQVSILSANIGYQKHSKKYVKGNLEYTQGVVKAHIDRYDNSIIVIYNRDIVDETQLVDKLNAFDPYYDAKVVATNQKIQVALLPANLEYKHSGKYVKDALEYTRGVLYAHPERYHQSVFVVYDTDMVDEKQLTEVVFNANDRSGYYREPPVRHKKR